MFYIERIKSTHSNNTASNNGEKSNEHTDTATNDGDDDDSQPNASDTERLVLDEKEKSQEIPC